MNIHMFIIRLLNSTRDVSSTHADPRLPSKHVLQNLAELEVSWLPSFPYLIFLYTYFMSRPITRINLRGCRTPKSGPFGPKKWTFWTPPPYPSKTPFFGPFCGLSGPFGKWGGGYTTPLATGLSMQLKIISQPSIIPAFYIDITALHWNLTLYEIPCTNQPAAEFGRVDLYPHDLHFHSSGHNSGHHHVSFYTDIAAESSKWLNSGVPCTSKIVAEFGRAAELKCIDSHPYFHFFQTQSLP